jgi:translation initiation factor 4G
VRPDSLPEMTITKASPRRTSQPSSTSNRPVSNRPSGDGGEWSRGSAPKRPSGTTASTTSSTVGFGGGQWSRGQAPPKIQNPQQQQQGGRGGGRGGQQQPFYDGPVAPLVKTENQWKPKKSTSAFDISEKKVKSLLNKMTKEMFDRLSAQMLEIPILTYETLAMMIDHVYDKAIDEPAFGDIYADLCVSLSQLDLNKLVHIIESDEEPPTEDAAVSSSGSSHHTVYRWSNDITTTDDQIVGPLPSVDECRALAMGELEQQLTPVERGDMDLELVSVSIKRGIFIKIMKKKTVAAAEEGEVEGDCYYAVYFPAAEAKECGQQLSDIFLSQIECESDASKKNSFKRSLLNKCEEEFNKQDIYVDWMAEKKAYEESKSSMTDVARKEKEEELNFRRIRIKKQMLGNVKFIGQLFKKRLLKEKIMRYCVASLLKLEEIPKAEGSKSKNPEYKDSGKTDMMDEEDHEAICNMFGTMGSTIDTQSAANFMAVCFKKIGNLSNDSSLPSRSRFMYKDLLELRESRWIPRRKEEKAKTLEEIRKDVEREERNQAMESQRNSSNISGRRDDYSSRGGGVRGGDRDSFRSRQQTLAAANNRPRQPKPTTETDSDGFTTVVTGIKSPLSAVAPQRGEVVRGKLPPAPALVDEEAVKISTSTTTTLKPQLSEEKLEKCIKSMRSDFLSDGGLEVELLLSMDEISDAPGAGIKLVARNTERLFEAKDVERAAIYRMISILLEKGKLTKEDAKQGTLDSIEFIDSTVMDSPRAYEYLGQLLGDMLRLKAIDISWLCEQCEKTKMEDPDTKAPEKLVRFALLAVKASGGSEAVKEVSDNGVLSNLLGEDTWKAMSQEVS